MKKSIVQKGFQIVSLVFLCIVSLLSVAQDKGVDIDINVKKEHQWYQQPWVWIVGGAVFILLLVAILRPRKKD